MRKHINKVSKELLTITSPNGICREQAVTVAEFLKGLTFQEADNLIESVVANEDFVGGAGVSVPLVNGSESGANVILKYWKGANEAGILVEIGQGNGGICITEGEAPGVIVALRKLMQLRGEKMIPA